MQIFVNDLQEANQYNLNCKSKTTKVILEVSESEAGLFLDTYYNEQLKNAKVTETNSFGVKYPTVQEIMDEFDRETINNWRVHNEYHSHSTSLDEIEESNPYFVNTNMQFQPGYELESNSNDEALYQYVVNNTSESTAEIVWAVVVDGYTIKEFAEQKGLNYSTAKKRYERGLKKLKKFF